MSKAPGGDAVVKETKGQDVDSQLVEMQRKYRIMEGNRKSYSEDSQNIIKRQRATIEKLKSENDQLKEELSRSSNTTDTTTFTQRTLKEMHKLQDEADQYTRKIEVERRRLEEIEKQAGLAGTKVFAARAELGGVNATKENDQSVNKQIKVLENRLDKALTKFNEALSHNKVLRGEIDDLRRERRVFEQIYKKLERALHEKKREMVNVIEISNIAYEARDQAQNEIAALRAQADKEQGAFEAEWRELGKVLEAEKKTSDANIKVGGMDREQEKRLHKTMIRGSWQLGHDKNQQDMAASQVQMYDDAFAKIQAATGLTDINELVTSFINAEDQNFSLFNFANELNQDTEKLEEQVAELKTELEKYKGLDTSSGDQRRKLLKDLERRLQRAEGKSESYEQKYKLAYKTVTALKSGIQTIYSKIGTSETGPENPVIEENNMVAYLSTIEQRANQLLQINSRKAPEEKEVAAKVPSGPLGAGPHAPVGIANPSIDPPSTADEHRNSDEESEEEVDDRPLTRDELQAKTLRNLNKRDSRGAQRMRRKK